MNKKTIRDIDVQGKKVFVRCDFNVPMKDGIISDDNRIQAALPTIQYLVENGAKAILCSHLGRPKGEVNPKYSLKPVAKDLSEKLGKEVKLAEDITGNSAKQLAETLKEGEVMLLENVRFDAREEKNEESLSKELASLVGEDGIYVNDAFGTAHRAHSSTEGIAHYVEQAVAGFLMEKEVQELGSVLESPEKPFVAILGGAKVSDKIGVIENLLEKVNKIIIGGAMANTFLKAKGYEIGSSVYEAEKLNEAERLIKAAEEKKVELVLPIDGNMARIPEGAELTVDVIENALKKETDITNMIEETTKGFSILDIGDKTIKMYEENLKDAKTICWNGPLGYAEAPSFAKGTQSVANIIANNHAKCVIGGGDSVAAVKKIKKRAIENGEDPKQFENIYLSTGGGASLEFLEGKELPGIKALEDK
ncbi:MAG: phosphoglycerate kinase [Clostridia bacterium]|nr:phosphoglycerate kinase [Clostridia bacterium]